VSSSARLATQGVRDLGEGDQAARTLGRHEVRDWMALDRDRQLLAALDAPKQRGRVAA